MRWALWLLMGALLAGCSEPAAAPEPSPAPGAPIMQRQEPEPLPEPAPAPALAPTASTFTHLGCDAVVFVHAMDFADANARLPLGYVAADLGYLLDLPTNVNRGAVGLITYACADDQGRGGHSQASIGIFVDPPSVQGQQVGRPDVFIDVYEFGRFFSDAEHAAPYRAAHWNVTTNLTVDVQVVVPEILPDLGADPRQPNPLVVTSEGHIDGERAWTGGAGGATAYRLANQTIRFWHDSPAGVSYLEYTLDRGGRGGASTCIYDPGPVRDAMDRSRCLEEDGLGLVFEDFSVQGRIVHLPGVHA